MVKYTDAETRQGSRHLSETGISSARCVDDERSRFFAPTIDDTYLWPWRAPPTFIAYFKTQRPASRPHSLKNAFRIGFRHTKAGASDVPVEGAAIITIQPLCCSKGEDGVWFLLVSVAGPGDRG